MPTNYTLPILVRPVGTSFAIDRSVEDFDILPPCNPLSEFEDNDSWSNIRDGFDKATVDPTILLHKFALPADECQALSQGIRNGTASIVSDSSYDPTSCIGPAGLSAVIMAPSTDMQDKRHWVKGRNWVTVPPSSQSAYRSELAAVIASLTMLDIIIRHDDITEGAVTVTLDGLTAMQQAGVISQSALIRSASTTFK